MAVPTAKSLLLVGVPRAPYLVMLYVATCMNVLQNGISFPLAALARCMSVTDGQTDGQTDNVQ